MNSAKTTVQEVREVLSEMWTEAKAFSRERPLVAIVGVSFPAMAVGVIWHRYGFAPAFLTASIFIMGTQLGCLFELRRHRETLREHSRFLDGLLAHTRGDAQ